MPTLLRTNSVRNPNFESNVTFWGIEGGAVLARDTVNIISGTGSAKLNGTGGDTYATAVAAAGQSWTLSLSYRTVGVITGNPRLGIGDGIAPALTIPLPLSLATAQRFSINLPNTSVGTTQVLAVVFVASGGDIIFDNVLLERSATPTVYFDGSTANTVFKTYSWAGAANASVSNEYSVLNYPASQLSLSDLKKAYYTVQGATGLSVNDLEHSFMQDVLGMYNLSMQDLQYNYWKAISGLDTGLSVNDYKFAVMQGNEKNYYAQFFS